VVCFDALTKIGWPEGRIILAETTVYLATSPKSNSAYMAIDNAIAEVSKSGNLPVPLHLRNAPTQLMKDLNYSKGYKYAHSYEGNFVEQDFLPPEIAGTHFWVAQNNAQENKIQEQMKKLWGK
jgi:putative ATPase